MTICRLELSENFGFASDKQIAIRGASKREQLTSLNTSLIRLAGFKEDKEAFGRLQVDSDVRKPRAQLSGETATRATFRVAAEFVIELSHLFIVRTNPYAVKKVGC